MTARESETFLPRCFARVRQLGRRARLLLLPAALLLLACEPDLGQAPVAGNENAPGSCANQCSSGTPRGSDNCTCDTRCTAKGTCCADYATACGSKPFAAGSCVGACGNVNDQGGCYCDSECTLWGDCCADLATACGGAVPPGGLPGGLPGGVPGATGTCAGKCGQTTDQGGCYCSTDCAQWGDCCADYATSCGGAVPPGGVPGGVPGATGSCAGKCGLTTDVGGCYCSTDCAQWGDCCADYATSCGGGLPGGVPGGVPGATGSCAGKCGLTTDVGGCYCSTDCAQWGDCCADYATSCGGGLPGGVPGGVPGATGTCTGKCGSPDDQGGCYCDWDCAQFGDCCANFATACP